MLKKCLDFTEVTIRIITLMIQNESLKNEIEELKAENKKNKALIEFQKGFIDGMKVNSCF
ncbi:hypothetical protein [Fusobacterium sp.]|uniref:hypothetical protein n=1 Tax=Fusobacterium sp. TaxID=68766 RepID=UPI002903E9AE|nr:hypothetical protein [Fusobacterium sp.]MDU1911076.1 hypothetical protein [Fusobacterium sp.]